MLYSAVFKSQQTMSSVSATLWCHRNIFIKTFLFVVAVAVVSIY